MSSPWLQQAPDHNSSREMKKIWRPCALPLLNTNRQANDTEQKKSFSHYSKTAGVRLHGYQCSDKESLECEVRNRWLRRTCATVQYSYFLTESAVWFWTSLPNGGNFSAFVLPVSHILQHLVSLNWDTMVVLFKSTTRDDIHQTCKWQSDVAPPRWKRKQIWEARVTLNLDCHLK